MIGVLGTRFREGGNFNKITDVQPPRCVLLGSARRGAHEGHGSMDKSEQARRLVVLRAEMKRHELTVLVVPRVDENQCEYVAPCFERLAFISGFTGSAGLLTIGLERAALFVDGRYTIQAAQQIDSDFWEQRHASTAPPADWLAEVLSAGDRVGFDARLFTTATIGPIRRAVEKAGGVLVPLDANPIDVVWGHERPAPPMAPVEVYPEFRAGESSATKRHRMASHLRSDGIDALVISAPDCLAWLLNIRGGDLEDTPFVLGFAILRPDATVTAFIDARKLQSEEVREYFAEQGPGIIDVKEPAQFGAALDSLNDKKVRVDRGSGSLWIINRLEAAGASVDVGADPCMLAKACKNPVEVEGFRQAHLRDGAVIVRFLRWFESTAPGDLDEIAVSDKLYELRAVNDEFRTLSFSTISAAGPNSALPHYKALVGECRKINEGDVYLVDSGGQYIDGTTDITRVVSVGPPTEEMKRRYTQVLKGHIALGRARFPEGVTGSQLDPFARQHLWHDGVDFDHGTGHGVGAYLSVHEGPQRIAKGHSTVPIMPGMVVSNEPGYYKSGAFGFRIENLMAAREVDPQPEGAEQRTLEFETLTLAPYHRPLIEVSLLDATERAWVDAYHARVREELTPLLDKDDAAFLADATAPL